MSFIDYPECPVCKYFFVLDGCEAKRTIGYCPYHVYVEHPAQGEAQQQE